VLETVGFGKATRGANGAGGATAGRGMGCVKGTGVGATGLGATGVGVDMPYAEVGLTP